MPPIILMILALLVGGALMLIGGVYILAGQGFALLAGGALMIVAAGVLRYGMKPHG